MDEKTFDVPFAEDARFDSSATRSARHSGRGHSYRSSPTLHKVSRRLALMIALSVSLAALFIVIIFSVVHISGLVGEGEVRNAELAKLRQDLSQAGIELERARKILSEMTKGRLPHLIDLVPDKVLKINGSYLKNIVFTVLNQNATSRYEYKLVMENTTTRTVYPEARIFVFDRYGVQIGSAEVAGRSGLAPGESRSQTAVIDRFIDEDPRYFYVSTSPADKPVGLIK